MVMMGAYPVGSQQNYGKILYDTIDSQKLQSLFQQTGDCVNKAPESPSLPLKTQQVTLESNPPILPTANPTQAINVNFTQTNQEHSTLSQTDNPAQVVQITSLSGQDIINVATTHILPQEIDASNFSTSVNTSNLQSNNMGFISTEGTLQNISVTPRNEEEIMTTNREQENTNIADEESESVMNDIIDTYSTVIEVQEEMDISKDIPISNPSSTVIDATPVVRAALMDFKYRPMMGEVYQVNCQGHLLKLALAPGTIYQVDSNGLLQEILLPLPLTG